MIANDNISDDVVLPFALESSALRGRIVRLGPVATQILTAHDYPQILAATLAKTLAAATLFAAMIKYEGVFSLQFQGDGPVDLMVVDVTSAMDIRGYANARGPLPEHLSVGEMFGKGHIAFTVMQDAAEDRYQGIVPIEGESIEQICTEYFAQSEQIDTCFRFAAHCDEQGQWRVGGVMLQRMPDDPNTDDKDRITRAQDWDRARVLLRSVTDDELTRYDLSPEDVLYRLFHEEGVRVFDRRDVARGCRCTPEKLSGVLASLSDEDRKECVVDGCITMRCEFCSKDWRFTQDGCALPDGPLH